MSSSWFFELDFLSISLFVCFCHRCVKHSDDNKVESNGECSPSKKAANNGFASSITLESQDEMKQGYPSASAPMNPRQPESRVSIRLRTSLRLSGGFGFSFKNIIFFSPSLSFFANEILFVPVFSFFLLCSMAQQQNDATKAGESAFMAAHALGNVVVTASLIGNINIYENYGFPQRL